MKSFMVVGTKFPLDKGFPRQEVCFQGTEVAKGDWTY